uniref:Uncharacterized protein n=1 Tax=Klebsiella pneumoniae TaxID=573 RepID=A0A6M5ZZE1_KLEPN|nr:hypothetical protein [Klebsiella pneumoniae]
MATTSVLVQGTDNPRTRGNTIQPVLLGTGSADNPRTRGEFGVLLFLVVAFDR